MDFDFRINKGEIINDDIILFDIKDHCDNKFEKCVKISKKKLEILGPKYYMKDINALKFDLYYKQQKGCAKYELMYFEQPYKI